MYWSIVITSAAAGLAAVAALLWFWWWRFPKRQVDRLRLTIRDPKARADIEDNLRKTIGQLIGGAAVLIGAGLAYLQFTQQQQASQQQFLQQQQASRDLLISNQVAKGFEQLGSDKVVVRLGGIYALEGVMNNSEQYHQPTLEALSAFVRDRTRAETGDGPPATDIQAALTVIARRAATEAPESVDLAGVHICRARLVSANLSGADLRGADLRGANLGLAVLHGAIFSGADLSHADLSHADLSPAHPTRAELSPTILSDANLSDANLSGAILRGVYLRGTDLNNASLHGAYLSGGVLPGDARYIATAGSRWAISPPADLSVAHISGADLTGATVSQEQLDKACGINVRLDPGLTIKPCP
jgi:uncharacterized protein YjbI with pentapeptide repeats